MNRWGKLLATELIATAFSWIEPAGFGEWLAAQSRERFRRSVVAMGVFTAATLVAANRFAAHGGRDVPSLTAATATAVGVLALHGLVLWLEPRLAGRLRRKVRFHHSKLQAISWFTLTVPWGQLKSHSWERCAPWHLLILHRRRGAAIRLGVPLDAPTEEISAWLTGRGLTDERLT